MNIANTTAPRHFQILCAAESLSRFVETISIAQIIAAAGLILFAAWLLRTSWGRKALVDSPARFNSMPPYLPLIVLFVWFTSVPLAVSVAELLMPDLADWQKAGLTNLIYCLCGITIAAGTILLAKHYFDRRLKGFGLDIRTIHKDFLAAIVNLLCVWPLVMTAILLTMKVGTMIWGPDFEMPQHEQLKLIGRYSQWSVRVLTFIVAAVMAPLLEELLFRGLFQTVIRTFLADLKLPQPAWLSIAASSVLFAAAHADAGHWPALFVLSLCIGYSYEKSGSLFRPILIHALFNGLTVLAVLTVQP
ncbi:MAG TPA: CPBP family intramembrane glutamic endopeptidase [Sedimentisphaerales bacterium]|nr:CPBP family intramembrane glutamic endopeptidase [Sedimentisphaerales bacterium]